VVPDQEIDVDTVMRNYLEFESGRNVLEGVLIYRIQRKRTNLAKSAHDESKSTQLLVTWRVEYAQRLFVHVLLVEHNEELDWNDKLRRLYQKYWHSLSTRVDPAGSNWLLRDATVLATSVKIMNGGYRWDIFISEGADNNVKRPLKIDAAR
jgi:hypothetical protein